MTDREKQIEEMAKTMCFQSESCRVKSCTEVNCEKTWLAEKLYNAGYRKQSGWISVDERLPETYEDVLCFDRRSVIIDFMCSDGTWCGIHDKPITHWMPLPEPPKMKEGESDDRN